MKLVLIGEECRRDENSLFEVVFYSSGLII